jgi:hypothetical protein
MQPIKTANTLERIIRNGIMTVMVLGFGVYFLYDAYIGYPAQNLRALRQELPPEQQEAAVISPAVRAGDVGRFSAGSRLEVAEEQLGPPAWKGPSEVRGGHKAVWFGPGGCLIIPYAAAGVITDEPTWRDGPKTETDLFVQHVLGVILTPLGVLLVLRLLAMPFVGVTLSDAGLKPTGRSLIPYEAMVDWDTREFKEKRRITLHYTQAGKPRLFVLDEYRLAAFKLIVEEIARRKGFPNPLLPPQAVIPTD